MNILQVPRRFAQSDWGGTETVVLETSKRLLSMGHRTEIICPEAMSGCPSEFASGVRVRRFPYFYPYFGLSDINRQQLDKKAGNLFSFGVMRALHAYPNLDLIHLHTAKRLGGIGRHVARQRRIPYVITLHGGMHDVPCEEMHSWTEPTEGAFEWGKLLGLWVGSRRVLDDAAAIICVGRSEFEQTRTRYPEKNVIHLPNGVETSRFAAGNGNRFRQRYKLSPSPMVLMVGRIDRQKNQQLLVRTLPKLRERVPGTQLVLIGPVTSDKYRRTLTEEIKKQAVAEHVTIIEGLDPGDPALVDAYHAADVFALASTHEPFGIVILEAWAAGLPVISSHVGGPKSLIMNGKNGLLFAPGNDGEFLTAAHTVLRDRALAQRLAACGRMKVDAFYTWDRITAALVTIYEDARCANRIH